LLGDSAIDVVYFLLVRRCALDLRELLLEVGDLALQLLDVRARHARRRRKRRGGEHHVADQDFHFLSSYEDEMIAAVLGPRRFIVAGIEGTLFAVADGADARGIDAEGDEVLLRLIGPAVAEGQVVLLGAA